jgi:hypothetical protein
MLVVILAVAATASYFYFYQLLFSLFYVVSKMFKLYIYVYDKLGLSKNSIYLYETIKLDDKVKLYKYKVTIDKKPHFINVVSDTKLSKTDIYDDIRSNFEQRTKFLHCSIMDEHDCAVDLTQSFREFVYHYDKTDERSLLYYFFKYVQYKHKTSFELLHEYDFVFYMNDELFSEKRYSVKECLEKGYSEILSE